MHTMPCHAIIVGCHDLPLNQPGLAEQRLCVPCMQAQTKSFYIDVKENNRGR